MMRSSRDVRVRRTLFALWATSASLLMSGLGATPAAASGGTISETAWIPLGCNVATNPIDTNHTYTGGIGTHIATALAATHPKNLNVGESFVLTGVSAAQVIPPASQKAGAVFGPVNGFEGVVSDFENNLTNATSNFSPGSSNAGKQVNQVQALQPTNDDAVPGGTGGVPDDKSFVSPDASDPSPNDMWSDASPAVPASDPRRQHLFSFGPIPIDSSTATVNAYGPAPGQDGGPTPTSGTRRPLGTGLQVGKVANKFSTTGLAGQMVVMDVGDSTRFVTNSAGGYTMIPFAAFASISFNDPRPPQKHQGTIPGTWGVILDVACGVDNTVKAIAPPTPGYCTNAPGTLPDVPAGCFVKNFTIPINTGTQVPEAPLAIMLPLVGLLVAGTWLAHRRRSATARELR
jgi:hypothetical protein